MVCEERMRRRLSSERMHLDEASTTTCIAVGQRTIIIPDGNPKSVLLQTVPYILSYA
jgi:hypothetical protein